ncbi:MAG: zeta toxin family protein [Armatimonadota bacterium]|nr:zeta toxin family protein [Armatimonadota bacterium]
MPDFYLIGGPNGAGKTTIALRLLPSLGCYEYVNADSIAAAMSPFRPDTMALRAGYLMMKRLRELADEGVSFATESTLAARAFVPFINECKAKGYNFNLLYIWLPNVEMAIARVADRVRSGGHSIPEETIRRRYEAGRKNFVSLYMPIAETWTAYDNSADELVLIATGGREEETVVHQPQSWQEIIRA